MEDTIMQKILNGKIKIFLKEYLETKECDEVIKKFVRKEVKYYLEENSLEEIFGMEKLSKAIEEAVYKKFGIK